MGHDELASRASLSIVRQAAQDDLRSSDFQIRIRQHDRDVLAFQLGEYLQSVGLWVLYDEGVRRLRTADETQAIYEAGLHDGPHGLPTGTSHEIDDTGGKGLLKGINREDVGKPANSWQLQHDDIPHEQGRDHHCVHLVQRVVERGQHHRHPNWPSPHTATHAADCGPAAKSLVLIAGLKGLDHRRYKLHGAIELRCRIC
mmetsp:Transcript_10197/g.27431  ORF Transcript_10197/g.27431 Transcript_10197/m.27431 type:complete len:200 (+) Transcript_10197:1096-1695(+)